MKIFKTNKIIKKFISFTLFLTMLISISIPSKAYIVHENHPILSFIEKMIFFKEMHSEEIPSQLFYLYKKLIYEIKNNFYKQTFPSNTVVQKKLREKDPGHILSGFISFNLGERLSHDDKKYIGTDIDELNLNEDKKKNITCIISSRDNFLSLKACWNLIINVCTNFLIPIFENSENTETVRKRAYTYVRKIYSYTINLENKYNYFLSQIGPFNKFNKICFKKFKDYKFLEETYPIHFIKN